MAVNSSAYFGCIAYGDGTSEGVHGLAAGGTRNSGALARILMAATAGVMLASCTSGNVPPLEPAIASVAETSTSSDTGDNAFSSGQTVLPDAVAVAPSESASRPETPPAEQTIVAESEANENVAEAVATETAENEANQSGDETGSVPAAGTAQAETVAEVTTTVETPEKKRRFLSSLWSPKPRADIPLKEATGQKLVLASAAPAPAKKPAARVVKASFAGEALPGVREDNNLFEIKRKSGLDDDSDVDVNENDGSYRVASAAGLARLAPNGLLTQREGVDVACLKPALVRVLKKLERHYGKRVVVTSGYRSPAYNRRARGARNSLHMYCAAVDIQIDGVTKWDLARYLRSMPGRGGVGTYCHTRSVHVDVGPERDWNWRCRRRKRRS